MHILHAASGEDKLRLALLRHGPTAWNAQGRIQGRIDEPLSAEGRTLMARLTPPAGFAHARAYTSPLSRARETAALLGFPDAVPDERLAEYHWGEWEGMTREEILARDGADAGARAGRAAAFTPKGGEPTQALLDRVADFLHDVAREPTDAIAITHRGVLRSAYTLATGWDMETPMPAKLDLATALILEPAPDGGARVAELNAPLGKK